MTRIATLLLLALAAPAWAHAQGLDLSKGGAIDVTAQDGMEWRQNEQMVIARGSARAVRGEVTVTADRLIARYRRKAGTAEGTQPVAANPNAPSDTGANEVYRLEAEGNVKIFTATDLAVGDKAVYDIDQAVLLLTGSALTITTPQQVMTARDTMEYWSQKRMAVGRGLAVVTTTDGRRFSGDTLVGFTQPPSGSPAPAAASQKPAAQAPTAGKPPPDITGTSGKLQRVEGFGNVEVRTAAEIVKGDRAVYVADTGIARIAGNVRITRGQNFITGTEALVNMRTGISSMVQEPGQRVQGLVMPNDASSATGGATTGGTAPRGSAPSTPGPRR